MVKLHLYRFISYDASHATNVKNVVKICMPTWSIFVGPVTYDKKFQLNSLLACEVTPVQDRMCE